MPPQRCPACVPQRLSPRSSIHPTSGAVRTPLASLADSYWCVLQSVRTAEDEHHPSDEGADTDDPRWQTCPKSAWWILNRATQPSYTDNAHQRVIAMCLRNRVYESHVE